ncbi:putative GNAT family N-acetyltransferase [Apodospora peruviana]|uniref:GNAT family N-acetyltransferase n=1 Tax=Apodospora peruviana TaxID=516989 RepID=A0AAE0IUH2_9PEZI|nr:putative GNAT family N-acetyltransferase [Apodospora peruviana]
MAHPESSPAPPPRTIPPAPTLPPQYTFRSDKLPSVPEYRHLRAASGLTPMTEAQSRIVPSGTWYGCHVTYNPTADDDEGPQSNSGKAIAMGRIVSDGAWYFVIADMAVLPDHQRKGLGDAILKHLLAYIKANAPEGDPYVNLLADPPGRKLYARNGFVEAAPKEVGMCLPKDWHLS